MKKLFASIFCLIVLCGILVPLVSRAHEINIWSGPGYWGGEKAPLLSCTGSGKGGERCDSICDLLHTFIHFIYFGMSLAVFAVAPVLMVWGGLMIVIAGVSAEKISLGKKIITGTLIGVAIVLLAYLMVNLVLEVLGAQTLDSVKCSGPTFELEGPPEDVKKK